MKQKTIKKKLYSKKGNPVPSYEVQKLRLKGEYEKAATELSAKLRKIFTFTGPGKMYVKRGRNITDIVI